MLCCARRRLRWRIRSSIGNDLTALLIRVTGRHCCFRTRRAYVPSTRMRMVVLLQTLESSEPVLSGFNHGASSPSCICIYPSSFSTFTLTIAILT
jgi:hypothetical protein